MTKRPTSETTGKEQGSGRFAKGHSGNPKGRPSGTRHKDLLALEAIGAEKAGDVVRVVAAAALSGDMRAADILLRRLWPERRGRPLRLDLPLVETASDLPAAFAALTRSVVAGEATPEEAQAAAALLEMQRRAIESAELEQRIAVLEMRSGSSGHGEHPAPPTVGRNAERRLDRLEVSMAGSEVDAEATQAEAIRSAAVLDNLAGRKAAGEEGIDEILTFILQLLEERL